mmetsp:Transcript_13095/g.14996  ORF Transcript_13095/g.14996 Transcript_13095/m.14996 type:complete len:377 (-) Transcript_13095:157-1287(-)
MQPPRKLHRSATTTHTAGPIGASYAISEKNWRCPSCKAENFSKRERCLRCRTKRPADRNFQVQGGGNPNHKWREALDPQTNQIYYYHLETGATQWDRPKEMGEAPLATGWFGRGAAGSTAQKDLDEKNAEYLKRPAPKQADSLAKRDIAYQEGSHEYNIWYNKFAGDYWNSEKSYEPAETRCKVALHAGRTRADKPGAKHKYFCIWWARGKCAKGEKCNNYHRIPTYADCGHLEKEMLRDVFGRERHASQRDDMDGVGSFNDSCRTLYVGRLQRSRYMDNPSELKDIVTKHFSEWGEVEHINIIWRLSIAFVRYRFRTHAELAKVAMNQQALDEDEVLMIRWAYEDPNPVAKEAIKRSNADAVVAAIKSTLNQAQK